MSHRAQLMRVLGRRSVRVIGAVLLLLCSAYSASQDTPCFHIRQKAGDPGLSEFEAKWYGEALSRMGEPRLPPLAKDLKALVYRFTILPTWGNPIAIRVQKQAGVFSLSARRLDGQGGYDPGKLVEAKEVQLTDADSKSLESRVTELRFFQDPTDDETRGLDGDERILEGVANGKYHVIQRWCAGSDDPEKRGLVAFVALCKFLVDKSTLSERPRNKGHELLSAG